MHTQAPTNMCELMKAERSAALLTQRYVLSQTAASVCLPKAKAVTENKHR